MAGNQAPNSKPLPVLKKTLPCLKCACNTDHQLAPDKGGAAWVCSSCKHHVHAYSMEDMMKTVVRGLFQVPADPKPVEVPEDFKVFLKSYVDASTEKEVDRRFVLEHARITGALPQVGKPLFAAPRGVSDAPAFMAVPYGEVIRIESQKE